ncbi:hypothetical protein [Streptomyces sp. NPDC057616]|uniref:hypothetical protein n=1 Tax=Streptomyces sp. NPDC057616 TaxID=3346183 RepID=UPI003695A9B1
MGLFSKRPPVDANQQEREIQAAKRQGSAELNAIRDRLSDGTATDGDKRIFRKVTGVKL